MHMHILNGGDNDLFFETNFESQNYLFLRMEYMYKKKNIVQNSKSSIAKSYSDCLVVWASPSQEEKKHIKQLMGPPNKLTFASSVFPVPGAPVKSIPCKKKWEFIKQQDLQQLNQPIKIDMYISRSS